MTELEIFQYIDSIITKEKIQACIDDKELFGITAKEIADHFSIYRSTVSNVLNNAVKEGIILKSIQDQFYSYLRKFLQKLFLLFKFKMNTQKQKLKLLFSQIQKKIHFLY